MPYLFKSQGNTRNAGKALFFFASAAVAAAAAVAAVSLTPPSSPLSLSRSLELFVAVVVINKKSKGRRECGSNLNV